MSETQPTPGYLPSTPSRGTSPGETAPAPESTPPPLASAGVPPAGVPSASVPPSRGPVVGYCRACGKALDAGAVRAAHGTIYCADHAPTAQAPAAYGQATYAQAMDRNQANAPRHGDPLIGDRAFGSPGYANTPYASPGYAGPQYPSPYTGAPPPLPHQDASPGLAFLLGLIPGVGAVYNGQYAKGLVHVVIVGLMISILSNGAAEGFEALLSLLLAAFWAYMAFEAFHTAKRRQLGQPVDEFSSVLPGRGGSRFPVAPVVLVALGVVFLLNNLQIFEIRRLLRYWPVLLIALGVYMLLERMSGGGRARHAIGAANPGRNPNDTQ